MYITDGSSALLFPYKSLIAQFISRSHHSLSSFLPLACIILLFLSPCVAPRKERRMLTVYFQREDPLIDTFPSSIHVARLLFAFACFTFDSFREDEKGLSFSIWFIVPEAKLILWQYIQNSLYIWIRVKGKYISNPKFLIVVVDYLISILLKPAFWQISIYSQSFVNI